MFDSNFTLVVIQEIPVCAVCAFGAVLVEASNDGDLFACPVVEKEPRLALGAFSIASEFNAALLYRLGVVIAPSVDEVVI